MTLRLRLQRPAGRPQRKRHHGHAALDHHEPVSQPVRLLQVLGGEHDGGPVGDQFPDHRPQLVPAGQVQPSGRFVQEQHRRPGHQRGRDVQPPAHPARVGPDRPGRRHRQAEPGEQLVGTGAELGPGQLGQAPDQAQVLPAGEVLIDGRALTGQPDLMADRGGIPDHFQPEHGGGSVVRPQQRGQDPDRGGLACAVRPEQTEHGPGRDGNPTRSRAVTLPKRLVSWSTTIAVPAMLLPPPSHHPPPMIRGPHGWFQGRMSLAWSNPPYRRLADRPEGALHEKGCG